MFRKREFQWVKQLGNKINLPSIPSYLLTNVSKINMYLVVKPLGNN